MDDNNIQNERPLTKNERADIAGKDVAEESKNKKTGENTGKTSSGGDLNNSGGRPSLDDKEKSEKTQANIKAEG